jgi:hypothetical protein
MYFTRIAWLALAVLAAAGIAAAQVTLSGRVVDENEAPVAGARVSAHLGDQPAIEAKSGPAGDFRLSLPAPETYLLDVDRAGYFQLTNRPVAVTGAATEVTLVLNAQHEVFQNVTVGAMPTPVDPEQTQREQQLSGTDVNNIPYPASQSLRNGMRLIPGVIQDPSGGIHFHGGDESQTRYTLDGFDISDPIDNRYSTLLAIEGVRTVDVVSSRETPQYGRGSAGTLEIHTDNGTDQFHYTATNFVPGLDFHSGTRIGDWTPRAGFSGPIEKGRAWFSDSFNGEYNNGFVNGLPSGQNTNPAWTAGNLFHTQVNLTPSDIMYGDLLSDFDHQAHYGLGVLDPISTTSGQSDSEWLAAVKVLHSWYSGAVLEGGFSWQRVYRRRVPEGSETYIISPSGRSGNYFLDSNQDGRRAQIFVNYFPQAWHRAGRHQLQIGADAQRLDYTAWMHRTAFEVIGNAGLPVYLTTFRGGGDISHPNAVAASYINDHWQLAERVTVDLGIRQEWDELVRRAAFGPRISASWAPFADGHTKVTAGFARVYDATSLSLFSRPLDQQPVTTPYSDTGFPEAPLYTTFLAGENLKLPGFDKWSGGVERQFWHTITGSVELLRKRGTDGFVYSLVGPPPPGIAALGPSALSYGFGGTYQLTNQRQDAYDEASFTARQTFGDQYGWMASYVRSRAVSYAVLDIGVDQPLQVADNFGRMPWDTPNRLMGWAYLPLPFKDWAVSTLVDYRSGFPFSVTTDNGTIAGPVDSHRYPDNFDLNVHVERRFTFRGYRLAIRVGANNLTAHHNYTAVGNVIGSPEYLEYYGDEGRHFVVRLRMFGRAGKP